MGLVRGESVRGSDLWITADKKRFKEIFINAVDQLAEEICGE